MNPPHPHAEKLRQLCAQGQLPHSGCSQAFLVWIQPLLDAGVLSLQRSGAGRVLAVHDADAALRFAAHLAPGAPVPPGLPSRIHGVATSRNSKFAPNTTPEVVLARINSDTVLRLHGQPVTAAPALTLDHGVFALVPGPARPYTLHGPCAWIENPAVFLEHHQLGLNVAAAFLGGGRTSARRLEWLKEMTDPAFRILHLPDYDPVGLSEHVRFLEALGPRVQLHLPRDLEMRFERFSNRDLLAHPRSQTLLADLRRHPDPTLQHVVNLIDRHNAGLEQEALLL